MYAAAVCLTQWLAPHAMIYDLSLLVIPAVLLWEHAPDHRYRWRSLFAGVWLALLFSGPLTYLQSAVLQLPFVLQISVPVWGMAFYQVYRQLQRD